MFSTKIYVLSAVVFSLFSLGQAAPIIDEVSSLSTRELEAPILDARGIFEFFQKRDAAADNVTDIGTCLLYNTYKNMQAEHENSLKVITEKMGNSTKKPEQKAYKKLVKAFTKQVKSAKKNVAKQVKALKKHKKDVTSCAPPSTAAHTDAKSDSPKSETTTDSSNQHQLKATSHKGSHAPSHPSDSQQ